MQKIEDVQKIGDKPKVDVKITKSGELPVLGRTQPSVRAQRKARTRRIS